MTKTSKTLLALSLAIAAVFTSWNYGSHPFGFSIAGMLWFLAFDIFGSRND